MKFIQRQHKGILVGYLQDDKGRKVEVRHDTEQYSCEYDGKVISAATVDALIEKYMLASDHVRQWQDVIEVTIRNMRSQGCPSTLNCSVEFQLKHISQLHDGSWVWSQWNPDAVYRPEMRASYPADMSLPCQVNQNCYSGSTTILLPYSETTLARVKQFDAASSLVFENFRRELLNIPEVAESAEPAQAA